MLLLIHRHISEGIIETGHDSESSLTCYPLYFIITKYVIYSLQVEFNREKSV